MITDVAGRRDVLHCSVSNQIVMIRFVGNALHSTDRTRLDEWVQKFGEWFGQGIKQVYLFMHQPEEAGTLELIDYFVEKMNQEYHLELKSWNPDLADPQPKLLQI